MKSARIKDQLKFCSDRVQKLAEDRSHDSATLKNTQKKLLDMKTLSLQIRESLEELQSKVDKSGLALMGVLIELEKERLSFKVLPPTESCHRKCPVCAASFGPNDVKPVFI
ncbi:hypothetical protein Dsin_008488 [Dipteronia sinensis]|uniref:E3 ubiquitin protein ligase n=1 Tax=Dipteronia sinensis TaxID=43782 RepID=A0AAE0APA1_9ROSI|nr:hypothetical protein Dsin_008488 [Dipteronia sinensis]